MGGEGQCSELLVDSLISEAVAKISALVGKITATVKVAVRNSPPASGLFRVGFLRPSSNLNFFPLPCMKCLVLCCQLWL